MERNLATLALIALVALAAFFDLRERRIPNPLTLAGLLVGLALRVPSGAEAVGDGVLGAAIGLTVAAPFVALGGLGGGDAKLLAAVGAFLGLAGLPAALTATAIAGGVMALAVAVSRGRLGETLAHCGSLLARVRPGGGDASPRTLATPGALAIPYGVPIGVGAMVGWWA